MKKKVNTAPIDEMPDEYSLDHSRAKRNRFAARLPRGHVIGIVLEEDVAAVFDSSEAVNRFLRSAIQTMPARAPERKKDRVMSKATKRHAS